MEAKGSTLLRISSILMIIGGIAGALGSVLLALMAGVSKTALQDEAVQQSMAEAGTTAGAVTTLLWVATIIAVVSAVLEIIAGVKGKKNWNNPAKAKTLMGLGIACAAIALVSIIISFFGDGVSVLNVITGLALPVLYIIGTIQLKKQA